MWKVLTSIQDIDNNSSNDKTLDSGEARKVLTWLLAGKNIYNSNTELTLQALIISNNYQAIGNNSSNDETLNSVKVCKFSHDSYLKEDIK